MDQQAIVFRRASEQDQQAIRALVHSERLNPTGINWPNFLVAAVGGRVVGAAQVRNHTDGSRELGSLVVAREKRGQGIASRMIDALLADEREPIWMITSETYARNLPGGISSRSNRAPRRSRCGSTTGWAALPASFRSSSGSR